jgi:chemotaxis protein methyltransferase CheR
LGQPLSRDVFRLLRDLIYEHAGLWFEDDNAFLLSRRLSPRVEALALGDFADYYRYLRLASPEARRAELEEICDRITTNETYFFREGYQLEAFKAEILPELADAKPRGKRLTVWSAGCSTGEEAYTIAILILETGLFADWDVRVFGSDISRRVLQVARRAQYGKSSFRSTDARLLRRYFREIDGKHQVRDEVRQLVSFGQINLIDDAAADLLGEVDVVFCRNVLIYFDQRSRRRVIDTLYRKLVRGGYLLLGHSESLITLTTAFELVHLKNDMVYRKPFLSSASGRGGA